MSTSTSDTRRERPDPARSQALEPTGVTPTPTDENERQGMRIGTIFGIEVRVDWSLGVVVVLLSWSLASVSLPSLVDGYSDAEYWIAGIGTTLLFLLSLLAHELSHSVVARRLGIGVRDITLWLFGGVSRLEGEARTPRGDFAIAFAGPATSIVAGIVSGLLAIALAIADVSPLAVSSLWWLAVINVLLAVFNLIPAAPLDGGRVLRAWLWHRSGDHDRAAIKAARAGTVFGWILAGLGVLDFIVAGNVGGLWLVFLGWFLIGAARAEEQQVLAQHALQGVRVGDVMTPSPITAPADISVGELLDDYVLEHPCSAFPVVDASERVSGLVTLAHCKAVPGAQRASTPVRAVATPLDRVPIAAPEDLLLPVLQRAQDSDGRVLVMSGGRDGELVGIVTPTDVMRAVQRARARESSLAGVA